MEGMESRGVGEGDFILISKRMTGDLGGKMKIEYLSLKHIKPIHRLIYYFNKNKSHSIYQYIFQD